MISLYIDVFPFLSGHQPARGIEAEMMDIAEIVQQT